MPILYIIVIVAIAIAVFAAGFADEKYSRQSEVPLMFRGAGSRGTVGIAGSALPGRSTSSRTNQESGSTPRDRLEA